MGEFKLQFDPVLIPSLSERYGYDSEDEIVETIGSRAKKRGFFTADEFREVCYWKTPRSQSRVKENTPALIEEVTRIALSTPLEELRIGVLTILSGVFLPTASVILHFSHKEPYPIIDFRALWSLGAIDSPQYYTFGYWWKYAQKCREIAEKHVVSMRTLDRALWQYSKENQKA